MVLRDEILDRARQPCVARPGEPCTHMPMQRVRALFPQGRVQHWRVTLAPPLARAVCSVHPALYGALNLLPPLRTHVLAWIEKPRSR